MGLARADDVGKTKDAAGQFKHVAVGGDKTFTGQFARPIGGDRNTWAVVLSKSNPVILAIHAAAGSVKNLANLVDSHCFENILREVSAFPEINVWLANSLRYVRVRGEMKNRIAACHRLTDGP